MTTVTVKASGGDYTTLQAAINACPGDITAAGTNQTWEIECYASVTGTAVRGIIDNKITDATHFMRIYTPPSERHNGLVGSTGFTLNASGGGNALDGNIDYLKLEGLRFTSTGGQHQTSPTGTVAHHWDYDKCLFEDLITSYGGIRINGMNAGEIRVRNCVFYHGSSSKVSFSAYAGSGYTIRFYNCNFYSTSTSTGSTLLPPVSGFTGILINGIGEKGGTAPVFGSGWTGSNNRSSHATDAPGTSSVSNVRAAYVDAANGNLRLTSGDTVAKNAGLNLSADGSWPFTDDILSNTRPSTWDIGAHEEGAGTVVVELAGAAVAGAAGTGTLSISQQLAVNAVARAIANGTLSALVPLTGAAIAAATAGAALEMYHNVWRVPTSAANGSVVKMTLFSSAGGVRSFVAQGFAVVAGGFADLPTALTSPSKMLCFVDNWNDDINTVSIFGGPSIANLTSL